MKLFSIISSSIDIENTTERSVIKLSSNTLTHKEVKIPSFLIKLYENLLYIIKDKPFILSLLAILFKTFLLIALTSDSSGTRVNIKTMFFSVPPLLVYISFICLFLSFAFIFKGKVKLFSFLVLDIILTVLIIGDLWYFRSNSSFLTFHMIQYTPCLNNLSESIFAMFRWIDILFVVDIFFFFTYFFKIKNTYALEKRNIVGFFLLLLMPICYLTYNHYKVDIFKKGFYEQYLFRTTWTQNQNMFNLSPIGYHLYDGYTYYKDSKKHILAESEKSEIDLWMKNKAEKLPDNKYKGLYEGKNLIMLQVESLENFVINQSIDGKEITPNLNKLIKNSIYFNNIKEQTHGGTTSDGELLANTSIFPVRRGSTFFRYPSNTYVSSLPELMESKGYNSVAIHPDKGSYWNWLPALSSIGFNNCIDEGRFKMDETIGLGLSDRSFLKQLVPILKEEKSPFFNFSITLSSHSPFTLPEEYKNLKMKESLKNTALGNYFESINYTDTVIGEFVQALEDNGILDNSVLVIYGDHEGQHKFAKDKIKEIKNVPDFAKENNLNVPLFIYSKDSKGENIDISGGQIDILPTVAYLMGVDPDKYIYNTMGRNLLNTKRDFVIMPNGNIQSKNLSKEEIDLFSKAVYYSNKIIESNYFKKEK